MSICLLVSSYSASLAPGRSFSVQFGASAKASSRLQVLFMMTPDHDPEFGFSLCPDSVNPKAKNDASIQITAKFILNMSLSWDFFRRNFIFKILGIEAVQPATCGLRLRIHQKADRRTARSWQDDIVREVVSDPVHLPRPEEPRTGLLHHVIVQRTISRRL